MHTNTDPAGNEGSGVKGESEDNESNEVDA